MDTIVALSSALPAAIAIVRLSGSNALSLLKSVYRTKNELNTRTITYGTITANNIKDNVTAVFYKGPNSYTGEDMVEIFTHGSQVIVKALISKLIENGARLANSGEFTMRAYLNNKMDLTKAEGVINLINSVTEKQAQAAFNLLSGKLRQKINDFQKELSRAIAYIEADLDYPEENVAKENHYNIKEIISDLVKKVIILKDTFNEGRLIKDGVKVVLLGNVNVGKSSLINALLKKERVIVSALAGTTRDVIEEAYYYKGQKFVLTDTAGVRSTDNEIEKIGVEKALQELDKADIILSVATANEDFIESKKDNEIRVENKSDLGISNRDALTVSALKGTNIDKLKEIIYKSAFKNGTHESDDADVITDLRHCNCLDMCAKSLINALNDLDSYCFNEITDCIASQLTQAYNSLGQITGVVGTDEIINEIFANFCVGK